MPNPVIHVADGELADEELVALITVLLTHAPRPEPAAMARRPARWHRLERRPSYRSPVSWR